MKVIRICVESYPDLSSKTPAKRFKRAIGDLTDGMEGRIDAGVYDMILLHLNTVRPPPDAAQFIADADASAPWGDTDRRHWTWIMKLDYYSYDRNGGESALRYIQRLRIQTMGEFTPDPPEDPPSDSPTEIAEESERVATTHRNSVSHGDDVSPPSTLTTYFRSPRAPRKMDDEYTHDFPLLLENPPTNRQEFYEWVQAWLDLEERHFGDYHRIGEKEVKEKLTQVGVTPLFLSALDTYLEDIAYGKPIWTLLKEYNNNLIRTASRRKTRYRLITMLHGKARYWSPIHVDDSQQ